MVEFKVGDLLEWDKGNPNNITLIKNYRHTWSCKGTSGKFVIVRSFENPRKDYRFYSWRFVHVKPPNKITSPWEEFD